MDLDRTVEVACLPPSFFVCSADSSQPSIANRNNTAGENFMDRDLFNEKLKARLIFHLES
jgi:hypothetical protein